MGTQNLCSAADGVVGAGSFVIDTETVMNGRNSVQRQTDQELFFCKKRGKSIIKQDSVCLERIIDRDVGFVFLFHRIGKKTEKRQSCQKRFSALKGKGDSRIVSRARIVKRFCNDGCGGLFGHHSAVGAGTAGGFLCIKTVGAAQIAGR